MAFRREWFLQSGGFAGSLDLPFGACALLAARADARRVAVEMHPASVVRQVMPDWETLHTRRKERAVVLQRTAHTAVYVFAARALEQSHDRSGAGCGVALRGGAAVGFRAGTAHALDGQRLHALGRNVALWCGVAHVCSRDATGLRRAGRAVVDLVLWQPYAANGVCCVRCTSCRIHTAKGGFSRARVRAQVR